MMKKPETVINNRLHLYDRKLVNYKKHATRQAKSKEITDDYNTLKEHMEQTEIVSPSN